MARNGLTQQTFVPFSFTLYYISLFLIPKVEKFVSRVKSPAEEKKKGRKQLLCIPLP